MARPRQTHCIHGHDLAIHGRFKTQINPNGHTTQRRFCYPCQLRQMRECRARKKLRRQR